MRSTLRQTTPGFSARIQRALSGRLHNLTRTLARVADGHLVMSGEQVHAMAAEAADITRQAVLLEDDARSADPRDVFVHPTIPAAIEKMFAAEEASTVARRRLTDRLAKQMADPDGAIVAGIDQAIARLEQAKALVAGGRAVQS